MTWNQLRPGGGGGAASVANIPITPNGTAITPPSSGNLNVGARRIAGHTFLALVDSAGNESLVGFDELGVQSWRVGHETGPAFFAENAVGLSQAGVLSVIAPTSGSARTELVRQRWDAAGVNAGAGYALVSLFGTPSTGNFMFRRRGFFVETMYYYPANVTGQWLSTGLSAAWDVGNPSSFFNCFFCGADAADTTAQGLWLINRGPSGAANRVQLSTITAGVAPRDTTTPMRVFFGALASDLTRMFMTVHNTVTNTWADLEITSGLPDPDVALNFQVGSNQAASGAAAAVEHYYSRGVILVP